MRFSEATSWSQRPIVRVCVPLLLSLTAAALALTLRPGKVAATAPMAVLSPRPVFPCAADVAALLGGVAKGADLGGFRVEQVSCERPRVIQVSVSRAGSSLDVSVAARGALPHEPPVRTSTCDLYYSAHDSVVTPDDIHALLEALSGHVRSGEAGGLPTSW